jgi:hypothetical protein
MVGMAACGGTNLYPGCRTKLISCLIILFMKSDWFAPRHDCTREKRNNVVGMRKSLIGKCAGSFATEPTDLLRANIAVTLVTDEEREAAC